MRTTLNCLTCRAVFRSSLKEREMAEKKLSPRVGLWVGGSGTTSRVQRAQANHQMTDGGDGGPGGQVFVGGVLGGQNEDQVDDEEDAAAGVSVGKASAAYVVPETSGGDVGEEGVVEDEAAGEADVGQDEAPRSHAQGWPV